MRKQGIYCLAAFTLTASFALGQAEYTQMWNFENDPLGTSPAAGWGTVSGTPVVSNFSAFDPVPYPTGNMYRHVDGGLSRTLVQESTNQFIFKAQMYTDAGAINAFTAAGLHYYYLDAGLGEIDAFYEGKRGGLSPNIRFGDPLLPPRGGNPDFQWPGEAGRTVYENALFEEGTTTIPEDLHIELKMEYNVGNDGRLRLFYRSLNFDNEIAPANAWVQGTWETNGNTYDDFILPTDPVTGNPYKVYAIGIGGQNSWSQAAFDNVMFQSLPEPGSLGLLLLSTPLLLRRRRA